MISHFFIDRPIFASVLSIVLVLAGIVAWRTLPVEQYPNVTPPTVQVTALYPGANALTVRDTVAAPIEQQVSGVEGMIYMSSQSTNDGAYNLAARRRQTKRAGQQRRTPRGAQPAADDGEEPPG